MNLQWEKIIGASIFHIDCRTKYKLLYLIYKITIRPNIGITASIVC